MFHQATDLKLGRSVAIKLLPQTFIQVGKGKLNVA
jgi:hypothetical protein